MIKCVGFEADDLIRAAMNNSGDESEMRSDLSAAAKEFVEYQISPEDIPDVEKSFEDKLISLSQVVSILRASVSRDYREDRILFRPQHEVGTRLAKQLKILLQALGLCNQTLLPNEEDYAIVCRVALDSCKGFNLEIVQFIAENPDCEVKQISEAMGMPMATIKNIVDDLLLLEAIIRIREEPDEDSGPGQPKYRYNMSEFMAKHWDRSGLYNAKEIMVPKPKVRMRFKKKK
jgi:hypothetical protein